MKSEREQIKDTAFELVKENGLINLSREDLCERVNIKPGSFANVMGCSFSDFIEELREGIPADENTEVHPVLKKRANPKDRKQQILVAAISIAGDKNYSTITRQDIADRAQVSTGLVARCFGTMCQVRRAIMRAAIQQEILPIIAQGLVSKDKNAQKAPEPLKQKAMQSFYK